MFRRNSSNEDRNDEVLDKLLEAVKKEVKQIMEEAVTRKFIHEESSSVTSLCGAVDMCLKYKLKRQNIGLFGNADCTTALLHRVAKSLDVAKETSKAILDTEAPFSRLSLKVISDNGRSKTPMNRLTNNSQKYTWIRLALFNKVLVEIITFLVDHSSKYYEPTALIADQAKGSLLAQLLEGPSALEFTKMKTSDHLLTDPNADELILRHRLHSGSNQCNVSPQKRPALTIGKTRRNTSSSSDEGPRSVPLHAREYVESLHQNNKTVLLYGKNNVRVQHKESSELLPGYLSLHQSVDSLNLKWTPNCLMSNQSSDSINSDQSEEQGKDTAETSKELNGREDNHRRPPDLYWDCAITVNLAEIVYIHCHHQVSQSSSLILVGVDGVQSSPFYFPFGGHLLAFLTCLEAGLQPHAHLEPPLWFHKDTGKIFPKLRRKMASRTSLQSQSSQSEDTKDRADYVFRIVSAFKPSSSVHDLVDPKSLNIFTLEVLRNLKLPWHSSNENLQCDHSTPQENSCQDSSSSTPDADKEVDISKNKPVLKTRDSIRLLCDAMKQQILSRAFYGWLTHCRHLRTVREHLSGLVYTGEVVVAVPAENETYLSSKFWNSLSDSDKLENENEIYRRIYYGGIAPEIRKEVWPYLLGHYKFGWDEKVKIEADEKAQLLYEQTMSQWLDVEMALKNREKECLVPDIMQSSLQMTNSWKAKMLVRQESSMSNEVFMDTVIVPDLMKDDKTASPAYNRCCSLDSSVPDDQSEGTSSIPEYRRSSSTPNHFKDKVPTHDEGYSDKLLEEVELNLHRIDKDVHRCDRTYWYFTEPNLAKLRNIMCTYVWKNLDVGYVQGMCDLVAPLLVVFDDEPLTYTCFTELMKRMVENFPNGTAMDCHLANMRSLLRVLDSELFELMHKNGDYTHFFFCYRWLLLDFKREMSYDDVFLIWESIWAAKHVCSDNYVVFIALGMVEAYREIILDHNMDFIDIMKFFNEMAEKHDAREVLQIARDLVYKLQSLIENK